MSEIQDALQVVNVTIKCGTELIEMPFKIMGGGMELLQRIMTLIEMSRKHRPVSGEVSADEIYKKYGNQVTVFSVPNEVKKDVYREFTKAGIEYSYFPSRDSETETSLIIPIVQCRTATEILERMNIEFMNTALDGYAKSMPEKNYQKLLEQARADINSPNFTEDGFQHLQETFLVNEYQEMMKDENMALIEVPKESVLQENQNTIVLGLPDGNTVEIEKKGMFAGPGTAYFAFLQKEKTYAVVEDGDKRLLSGSAIYNRYYNSVLPAADPGRDQYYNRLMNRLANASVVSSLKQSQEIGRQAGENRDQKLMYQAVPETVKPMMISIDIESLLERETADEYYVRIPKRFYEHGSRDFNNFIPTANGGERFYIKKSECRVSEDGKTIYHHVDPNTTYKLFDKDGIFTGSVTGIELYKNNFDVVTRTRKMTTPQI